jgi:hypothetical protein
MIPSPPGDIRVVNLRDLIRRYRDGTPAARAVELFANRRKDPAYLKRLLHPDLWARPDDPAEADLRAAVDDLLHFYGLVEIACLAGYVPETPPDDFTAVAKDHLGHSAVVPYCQEYPLLLPRLLRDRLTGKWTQREQAKPGLIRRFTNLLDINATIEGNRRIAAFRDLVLEPRKGPETLARLIRVLGRPRAFVRHMVVRPKRRTPLDRALHGFREFLLFSSEFNALMEQSAEFPLFRSAAWHLHAPWFQRLGEPLRDTMHAGLARFLEWDSDSDRNVDRSQDMVGEIERRKAMIDELFDERKFAALKRSWEEQSREDQGQEAGDAIKELERKRSVNDKDSERGSTRTGQTEAEG